MNDTHALEIVHKIFTNIFNQKNNFALDTLLEKFTFDIKLPKQVNDSTTNEITWADSINSTKFITNKNMETFEKNEYYEIKKLIIEWILKF